MSFRVIGFVKHSLLSLVIDTENDTPMISKLFGGIGVRTLKTDYGKDNIGTECSQRKPLLEELIVVSYC